MDDESSKEQQHKDADDFSPWTARPRTESERSPSEKARDVRSIIDQIKRVTRNPK